MTDAGLLALHRRLVATPSVSGEESAAAGLMAGVLAAGGAEPFRVGNAVYAVAGDGPVLVLDTHLDTVPAGPAWTRDPFAAAVEDGRVYGLGSNDAKASVAAMTAAFLRLMAGGGPRGCTLVLALADREETGCRGSEVLAAEFAAQGLSPAAVVIGEPTGGDLAVAQKGLMVLSLVARGPGAHAAHARALGVANPIVSSPGTWPRWRRWISGRRTPSWARSRWNPRSCGPARPGTWCRRRRAASWTCASIPSRGRRRWRPGSGRRWKAS